MSSIKERPILFTAPMVRALLCGRKKVTRRVVRHQPDASVTDAIPRRTFPHGPATIDWCWRPVHGHLNGVPTAGWDFKCPYGKPGDRLWVREAWAADAQLDEVAPRDLSRGEPIRYPADGAVRQTGCSMITQGKRRPSIHMPRWTSRILLEITDVRVERLQDISEAQALAEGIIGVAFRPDDGWPICTGYMVGPDDGKTPLQTTAAKAFSGLWDSVGGDWDANPWVWVVEFRQVAP